MNLPKTILVATDFGETSDCAIDYAISLAKPLGAQIVLAHTYEIPLVGFPDGAVVATAELTEQVLRGARSALDAQVERKRDGGVPIRGMLKDGDPADAVIESAKEVLADLIIVGTHGRTGLPRVLLGSVAEKIVRRSPVPVLTVHAPPHDKRRERRNDVAAEVPSHR